MNGWAAAAAALAVGLSTYYLLPGCMCRIDQTLRQALPPFRSAASHSRPAWLHVPARILNRLARAWRNRQLKAGLDNPGQRLGSTMLQFALPLGATGLGWLRPDIRNVLWLSGFFIAYCCHMYLDKKIKRRRRAWTHALYKVYRFLDEQVSSGISVTDALRGLSGAVRDPDVHPLLVRFSASFEMTLDLDQSLSEIRQVFGGSDCDMLAAQLRQCLQTGLAGRSLIRLESLLFTRSFALMQQGTRQIRTILLAAALLGIIPVGAVFLYPLIMEAVSAFNILFG